MLKEIQLFVNSHEIIFKVLFVLIIGIIVTVRTVYDFKVRERQESPSKRSVLIVNIIFGILSIVFIPPLMNFVTSDHTSEKKVKEIERLYDDVIDMCQNEEFDEAQYIWKKLLDEEPENARYRNGYANTLYELEDFNASAEQAKEAVRIEADNANYQNMAGVIYFQLADYETAKRYFISAMELEPDTAKYIQNIALTFNKEERYKEACEYFEKALQVLEKGSVKDPNKELKIIFNYGIALDGVSKYEEALVEFEKVYEQNNDYLNVLQWIDMEKARLKVIENPDDPDAINKFGVCLYDLKMYDEAYEQFENAIVIDPKNANFYYNACYTKYSMKEYEEAIDYINKSIELMPEAKYYINIKKMVKSEQELEYDPKDKELLIKAGRANYIVELYNRAKTIFSKGRELYPDSDEFKNYLDLLKRQEEYNSDQKLEIAEKLADIQYELELYENAAELYQILVRNNENNPSYHNDLGCAYYSMEEYKDAYVCFMRAVELETEDKEALKSYKENARLAKEYL
ncbi:MAG: hypothetical protein K2N87_16645 [Eubacterium sp.]|nr:hypothetical protein [Eubacterium sp.]